tara:strand:+ start:43 stop:426 length:384 start_codon:yes stop_codon:yes gene_type:complete
MSDSIQLEQNELTEAQTHINLIQKAYRKLESAQYAARELENDFRDLINVHIQQKGGDPELQYTLNTDTGALDVVTEEQQQQAMQGGNPDNGTEPTTRPSSEEVDPTGNFKFGDETDEAFQDGDVSEV